MPADVRTLCEDAMTVMENNGHVTLPGLLPNRAVDHETAVTMRFARRRLPGLTGVAPGRALIEKRQLTLGRFRLGEPNPNTDQSDGFASPCERFREQGTESIQGWLETGTFYCGSGKIGEFKFHENLCNCPGCLFLSQFSHQVGEQLFQFLSTLFESFQVDRKRFFSAERFAWSIRLNRAVINPSAKIVKLNSEFAEKLLEFDSRQSLHFATSLHSDLIEFLSGFFSHPQILRTGSGIIKPGTSSGFTSN